MMQNKENSMSLNRNTSITWLGHSTVLIQSPGGKTILIDPWTAGNPACPQEHKQIAKCDLMLLTHAHFDHMGDALDIAAATGAMTVGNFELISILGKKGLTNSTPMNKGGTAQFGDITLTMTHASHSSGYQDGDQLLYAGEAAGYVVQLENGFKIYHAGDTCVFGDMALIRDLYHPDLAMIPIGDHFTMGPREAALAVRLLGAKYILPLHWGTFPVLTGTPAALRELTHDIPGLVIYDLKPGDVVT
jgi:L-ascorbate metabolism protein UlaG (beta-lactamase superfamily)